MSAGFAELDWYDTPRDYDLVFDVDTGREVDFLEALHQRHGRAAPRAGAPRVLEPACGSGRLVVELARRGWRVTGSDRSRAMLDHARARLADRGLRATLTRADMADFRLRGRFELAHCMVSTFKYLLDEDRARSHLECVARALVPGGLYVLGLHLTDYRRRSRTRERWVVERDGVRVVCNIQTWPADRRRRLEQVRSRLVVREAGEERRTETRWTFRTYDARQLRSLLASVGDLEHVATHDFHYDPDSPRRLDGELEDAVLVLRRRLQGVRPAR